MLTVINVTLILVNLYSVGVAEKKLSIIEEKLDDLSMLEKKVQHLCENLDSCFVGL